MRWTGGQLLELWDSGARLQALDRALLMLASRGTGQGVEQLADMPLGERDQALLALRDANFGDILPGCVDCPACGVSLEFQLSVRELRCEPAPARIRVGELELRLPTSRDLALALGQRDIDAAARSLFSSCLMAPGGEEGSLPGAEQLASFEAALAQADNADMVLDFRCADCGHAWHTVFDIAAYLWQEVQTRARQLLRDVDTLARAYGWSEEAVLGLSDRRRSHYIGMVTA